MPRAHDKGFALVGALFMVLVVSVIGASLVFVSRTETLSSMNYKTMSQGRYAAESGIHRAANYLMFTYVAPDNAAFPSFDLTKSPVEVDGEPVVLSSDPNVESNYPDDDVVTAFGVTSDEIEAEETVLQFRARATLMSMRLVPDLYGSPVTVQTWEVTGVGVVGGIASSAIEVTTTLEREVRPRFGYAAFAVFDGCDALNFTGGSETSSYDSRDLSPGDSPPEDLFGGDVGTNGNLNTSGDPTIIHGGLSTPRSGVGNCSNNAITAADLQQGDDVSTMVQLPQAVQFTTPDWPSPMPPLTNMSFGSGGGGGGRGGGAGSTTPTCPAEVLAVANLTCLAEPINGGADVRYTLTPASGVEVSLGDVLVNSAGDELVLMPGNYVMNSLTVTGNAKLVADQGAVTVEIGGKTSNGNDMQRPLDLMGAAAVETDSFDASMLRFVYAGTSNVRLQGSAQGAMVLYAPNAAVELAGDFDFYGGMIGRTVNVSGGAEIHYDRNLLRRPDRIPAEFTMSAFIWRAASW